MRLACDASSLPSSCSADSDSSTLQAKSLYDLLQGDGPLFTAADASQRAFGQIQVLDLFQVLEDGFTNIVGLGAPGTPGKLLQALFDGLRKSNGQHNYFAVQVISQRSPRDANNAA